MFRLLDPKSCMPGGSYFCLRAWWVASSVSVLLAVGCKPREPIRHYQAPKGASSGRASPSAKPVSPHAATAGRMLAAVVPHKDQAWFFKVTGPQDALGAHAEAFRELLRSLRFADGKPQWKTPEGWRQQPGSGMRFATLELGPAGQALELTVIPLSMPAGDEAGYVLANVNRWRTQLGLPSIAADKLSTEAEQIAFEGGVATAVDLTGTLGSGGPPMSPGGPAGS
jgi:hypothetical protein